MERPDDYESITTLNISHKNLTELPSWISECKNLKILDCSWNNIMHLSNLPQTLENLFCWYNNITQINNLPPTLVKLYCSHNHITQLDNLPELLEELKCHNNPLEYEFEPTLENIRYYNNQNNQNKLPK